MYLLLVKPDRLSANWNCLHFLTKFSGYFIIFAAHSEVDQGDCRRISDLQSQL